MISRRTSSTRCWLPGGRSQVRSGWGEGSSSARRRASAGSSAPVGQQRGGEGPGGGRLAAAGRADERVGVGGAAAQRRRQGGPGGGLLGGRRGQRLRRARRSSPHRLEHPGVDLRDAARCRRRRRSARGSAAAIRSNAAAIRSWKATPSDSKRSEIGVSQRPRARSSARLGSTRSRTVRSGMQPCDGGGVQASDQILVEPSGAALVGDGRIDEAIADDVVSRIDRRADDPLDQLRPRGAEQHQLGPRSELDRSRP